jgi:hypothetical protein
MSFDQRDAKKHGPLLDEIPDVAVRQVGAVSRTGEFTGRSDLVENSKHDHRRLLTFLLSESPDGLNFDIQHRRPKFVKTISYLCES